LDDIENYLKFECSGEEIEGDTYLIEAEFLKKDIHLEKTIVANLTNSEEEEIYIVSMARPIKPALISTLHSNKLRNMYVLDAIADKNNTSQEFICN